MQSIKVLIILFCLCFAPFFSLFKNKPITLYSTANSNTTPHASSPAFTIDSENNLYLVFIEFSKEQGKIVFLQTNPVFEWNLTKEYLRELDTLETQINAPSIAIVLGEVYVVFIETTQEKSSLIILKRDESNNWSIFENITSSTQIFTYPQVFTYQDLLQLSWVSNGRTGGYSSLNYKTYNTTSHSWGTSTTVREITEYSCLWPNAAFDTEGNYHYVWSEGEENFERVLYRKVYKNNTQKPIYYLTSGDNRCSNPAIYIENTGTVNVFWNNITSQTSDFLGTKNIQYRKKPVATNWSNISEVAPYIPPLQPGEVDAIDPTVASSNQQTLWLGYEYYQDYLQEQGIAIRPRRANEWEPSERVTTIRSAPKDLVINADQDGNIHCIWLDFRSQSSYDVYYRRRETTSLWSEEIGLTDYSTGSKKFGQLVTVVVVGLVALSLPIAVYVIIRNRKREKIIDQKKEELMDE